MSLYFLTFLLLAAGVLLAWFRPRYEERIYWICWILASTCLCFRFGQGTDYVTYHALYETIPAAVDLSKGYVCGFYPEIGWRIVSAVFKAMHAPFWVFTMVLGLSEMLLVHRYLRKYVQNRTMGLFMLYPVLFITYMVSGIRQGLSICIFLGILVPFYTERRWGRYVAGVLLASTFHRVGYAWLVLPVASYLPVGVMAGFAGLSLLCGLVLQAGAVEQWLAGLVPVYHLQQFLLEGSVSWFALAERTLSFLILYALYVWYKREHAIVEKQTEDLLKAYMCGTCFYLLLCGSSYYASRYCAIFKVLEGAVLLSLIQWEKWIPKLAAVFFFGLTLLMGCKNLNAMIREGYWYDTAVVNIWNFPYISVFDRDEIKEYLPYEKLLWEIYGYNIEDQKLWMIEE